MMGLMMGIIEVLEFWVMKFGRTKAHRTCYDDGYDDDRYLPYDIDDDDRIWALV
jgi:hypothetical protein